jgi:hypothetical protein
VIVLLNTSHDLDVAERELGCAVGELFTPLNGFSPKRPGGPFAIDNGAFARFDPYAFRMLLNKHEDRRHLCKFVAVPDVVGSARRTSEVFERWYDELCRWPLAYVCQDGQEDLPIPWDLISAVFIGGSTSWKMSPHAAACVKAAKALGKWAHFGRVNTPGRFEYAEGLGCDSVDGTGLSRYSWMRERIHRAQTEPGLFAAAAESAHYESMPG